MRTITLPPTATNPIPRSFVLSDRVLMATAAYGVPLWQLRQMVTDAGLKIVRVYRMNGHPVAELEQEQNHVSSAIRRK